MTLQWTTLAGFLYSEIAVLVILLLLISTQGRGAQQNLLKLFRSKILKSLGAQKAFFYVVIWPFLTVQFIDAFQEMRKYSSEEYDLNANPLNHHIAQMQGVRSMIESNLFRAQRNYYISGVALFLSVIIPCLTTLLSIQESLMAENEALKQAASAIIDSQTSGGYQGDSDKGGDSVAKLQTEVHAQKQELAGSLRDKDVLKSQAENTNKEYDRLMKEHEKLANTGGDKKAD